MLSNIIMPKYNCEHCLKEFSQKSHYNKHLNKKYPCQDNKEKIEKVVENIIINKKLISNNNKKIIINTNTIIEQVDIMEEVKQHTITKNVELYINDANIISNKLENIDFIYMDPPYDTNRNFTLDSKSDKTGFTDKWTSNNYELWLSKLVSNFKKHYLNKEHWLFIYHLKTVLL